MQIFICLFMFNHIYGLMLIKPFIATCQPKVLLVPTCNFFIIIYYQTYIWNYCYVMLYFRGQFYGVQQLFYRCVQLFFKRWTLKFRILPKQHSVKFSQKILNHYIVSIHSWLFYKRLFFLHFLFYKILNTNYESNQHKIRFSTRQFLFQLLKTGTQFLKGQNIIYYH